MNKHDLDSSRCPAAPKPSQKGQPSTSKPEGLDDLADKSTTVKPDQKDRTRDRARE